MFDAYRKSRAAAKQQEAQAREARAKRQSKLEQALYARQFGCDHEFGAIINYNVSEGASGATRIKHFVICRKCALRHEV